MCLVGVVVRRYIDFLILFIPTPLVSALFAAASVLFVNVFRSFRGIIRKRRKKKNAKSRFFFSCGAYVNCVII